MSFNRLLRFKDTSDNVYYGELPEGIDPEASVGTELSVYPTSIEPWDAGFELTGQSALVKEILSPLPQVPIFLCIGLNYRRHALEAKLKLPMSPLIFTKPSDAIAGPFENIQIHEEARNLDYEGELCVVIGKDCRDLTDSDDVFEYILGYTAGNDVSSRYWQQPERCGSQYGYAKSFDKFAPIGPIIASRRVIPDPTELDLITRVNGVERQRTKTDDLIFDIPATVRFLSVGRTIRKGTVIMTGTPSGVAAFMTPPAWLEDQDVVEVEIEKIGSIKNKMVFD